MPAGSMLVIILVFVTAVVGDVLLIRNWRKKSLSQLVADLSTPFEITVVILWALLVASPLLSTPPYMIPNGKEFPNLVQTHFIWTLLPHCGLCMLWNGYINGGAPAFAELTGAILHPLVFIPVLAWGVIQGAKVTYAASLALAGLAQWGLARKLGLGFWARLWSGLIIIVGGHLAGKMDNGDIALVLGLACAALTLTFGVDLLFNRNRNSILWFSIALALTLLSGEGYIQIAVAISFLPPFALFCLGKGKEKVPAWKDYLLALGLAVLICGIFLVPLAHFLPQIGKDSDVLLSNFQPLEYNPLNLVIRDLDFQRSQVLGKDPYISTHLIYIGWAPVLLAILSLRMLPERLKRVFWVFVISIALVFLESSLDLPQFLIGFFRIVGKLRHLTVTTGLVVPLIVGLAAISLDEILKTIGRFWEAHPLISQKQVLSALPAFVVMIPFTVLSISPCYQLSQEFLGVHDMAYLDGTIQRLNTSSAQWVQPPFGFYDWTALALMQGNKISHTWRPWFWIGRDSPQPLVEATFQPADVSPLTTYLRIGKYNFVSHPEAEYAIVTDTQNTQFITSCKGNSQGGSIDIDCQTTAPGVLTIHENAWDSWYAWVDGKPVGLNPGRWLSVDAPAGPHHYTLRYLPWDVLLGGLVSLTGIILAIRVFWKSQHA